MGDNDSCWPGQETLAEDIGKDPKSIRKYLKQLVELKFISVEVRFNGRVRYHAYRMLWHEFYDREYVPAREHQQQSDDRETAIDDRETRTENGLTTGNMFPGNSPILNSPKKNTPSGFSFPLENGKTRPEAGVVCSTCRGEGVYQLGKGAFAPITWCVCPVAHQRRQGEPGYVEDFNAEMQANEKKFSRGWVRKPSGEVVKIGGSEAARTA
jgi:hypothetical protein